MISTMNEERQLMLLVQYGMSELKAIRLIQLGAAYRTGKNNTTNINRHFEEIIGQIINVSVLRLIYQVQIASGKYIA